MKKHIFLLIAILALGIKANAQDFQSVEVLLKDNSSVRIDMNSGLSARLSDGNLVFVHPKGELSFPSSDVRSWNFSTQEGNDMLSVISVPATPSSVLTYGDREITLSNLAPAAPVKLYTADGALLISGTAANDGVFVVPTVSLTRGVYVLAFGNKTIKILL